MNKSKSSEGKGINQKSRDKKKPKELSMIHKQYSVLLNKKSDTQTKELEWVNKIDFVDDWLEIDCEVIYGKKGVKTLIKFIQSLIQSTKEETRMECFDEQCELAEKQSKIASKAYNEGYSDCKKGRKKAPHDTRDGYCCACDYDLACFESKLKEAKEETIREVLKIIDVCVHEGSGYTDECDRKEIKEQINSLLKK